MINLPKRVYIYILYICPRCPRTSHLLSKSLDCPRLSCPRTCPVPILILETDVKVALQNNLLVQTTPVITATTKVSSPAEVSIKTLTKQMEQLSINYANLSNAMTNNNNSNNNRNRGRNYGTRPQVSFGNNSNRPSTIQCFNCGKIGHIARNCSAPRNRGNFQSQPRRNNPVVKPMNYMEYEEEDYYDDEYQEEEYYDDYEAKT